MLQLSDDAIRDTVAAVFRDPAYHQRRSLIGRFLEWLDHVMKQMFPTIPDLPRESPVAFWVSMAVFGVLVAALLTHVLMLARARRAEAFERPGRGPGAAPGGRRSDPWSAAEALAAAGQFTEAAHVLYRALLEALARRERLRLHPAKTVGDYGRELRAHASSQLARYRDFARVYEHVVYGVGTCDRERFERLHALAHPIVHARD